MCGIPWNQDGLDRYGVVASSEDFRAQRLEKGLAGAEIVHEEGVAVIGWETAACPPGSEAWPVFPEACIRIASWRTQGPSPHQVEHLFALGPGLVGYLSNQIKTLMMP